MKLFKQTKECDKTTEMSTRMVIDASFTTNTGFEEIVGEILENPNNKIVLISVTINELDIIQKYEDIGGKNANNILGLAVNYPEKFELVEIDETLPTADECIIEYCANKEGELILLTADKVMTLKARMKGITVEYHNSDQERSKIVTLYSVRKEGDRLIISLGEVGGKLVHVYSDGVRYTNGEYSLKVGDNIYIASRKKGYATCTNFELVSLYETENCKIVFSKRIYKDADVERLEGRYKNFMKEFMNYGI